MDLMRRTDFPEMGWLRRELDRLTSMMRPFEEAENGGALATWAPAVDVEEDDKAITIKADLPEVDKKDIDVSVENGTLTIRGERKREQEEKQKNYHRLERSYGSYMRRFALPDYVEQDKIQAECKDGVLTVILPKKEGAQEVQKGKKIDVK